MFHLTLIRLAGLLALAVGLVSVARAQADFRPGYVVLPAGDTLRGEVVLRGGERSLRECEFRPGPNAPGVVYLPAALRGYGLAAGASYRPGQLPPALGADTARVTIFLEVLVQGKATLLLGSNERLFLQLPPAVALEELALVERTVTESGRTYRQQIRQYQQVLLRAFADAPALAPRIRAARFGIGSLTDLFARYNAAVGGPAAALVPPTTHALRCRLGLVAGAVPLGRLALASGTTTVGYYNAVLPKDGSAVLGGQLTLGNTRHSRRLWLQVGAFYHARRYSGRGYPGTQVSSIEDKYYDLTYAASFVHLPVLLRYEPLHGRLRPVAELGLSFNFRLSETENTNNIHYSSNRAPTTCVLFENARTYEQAVVAGLGLRAALVQGRTASVVLRYERSNGVSSYTSVSSASNAVYLLLSYDWTLR